MCALGFTNVVRLLKLDYQRGNVVEGQACHYLRHLPSPP